MDNLEDLYQEIIIDHNKNPRCFGEISDATHFADGYNETCGDEVCIGVKIHNNIIEKINFSGQGCAISRASASMMCSKLQGMEAHKALQLSKYILQFLTTTEDGSLWNQNHPGQNCNISEHHCQYNVEYLDTKHEESSCNHEQFSLLELGDLSALNGVKQFPMRVKCATLAWHTFEDALTGLIPPEKR